MDPRTLNQIADWVGGNRRDEGCLPARGWLNHLWPGVRAGVLLGRDRVLTRPATGHAQRDEQQNGAGDHRLQS